MRRKPVGISGFIRQIRPQNDDIQTTIMMAATPYHASDAPPILPPGQKTDPRPYAGPGWAERDDSLTAYLDTPFARPMATLPHTKQRGAS